MIVRDINFFLSEVGITSATITSAYDLSTETKKAIEKFIVAKTKSSEVAIEAQVDPTVLGGVKISLPGYELDQTIAHQLTVLKTRFKKA
jgi:F0F1-type ATP synthase delta subunit